jgi:quercetin dioxygenase-like cupin family protein
MKNLANLQMIDTASLPWVPHRAFPGVEAQTIVDAQTGMDLEVKSVRVAPGAEIALHTHEGFAETFYVLQGEGLICTEGQAQPCHPGMCVHAKSGVVHGVKNTGEGDLRLLAVFTPPAGTPPLQERPDSASQSGGTDLARKAP